MQKSIRKNIQVYIPIYLIPALERIAERNKWDLDYVVEEAFIHYLNIENISIRYSNPMENKNWIKGAIKKPGALRKSLGAKPGKSIPEKKLAKAAKGKGITAKHARLAETLKSLNKKK